MNDTIALDWASPRVRTVLGRLLDGGELSVEDGIALTEVAGRDFMALTLVADEMRRRQAGEPGVPVAALERLCACEVEDGSRQAFAFAVVVEMLARRDGARERGSDVAA